MERKYAQKNNQLAKLILEIKTISRDNDANIWSRVAKELGKPTRNRRTVNVEHINKMAKEGFVIVVPGKVLSNGDITKKVDVAAYDFSDLAIKKITKAGGKAISLIDCAKKSPKGKGLVLVG